MQTRPQSRSCALGGARSASVTDSTRACLEQHWQAKVSNNVLLNVAVALASALLCPRPRPECTRTPRGVCVHAPNANMNANANVDSNSNTNANAHADVDANANAGLERAHTRLDHARMPRT
eukprot:353380-Chlamydomonas_euryale.AAC.5